MPTPKARLRHDFERGLPGDIIPETLRWGDRRKLGIECLGTGCPFSRGPALLLHDAIGHSASLIKLAAVGAIFVVRALAAGNRRLDLLLSLHVVVTRGLLTILTLVLIKNLAAILRIKVSFALIEFLIIMLIGDRKYFRLTVHLSKSKQAGRLNESNIATIARQSTLNELEAT